MLVSAGSCGFIRVSCVFNFAARHASAIRCWSAHSKRSLSWQLQRSDTHSYRVCMCVYSLCVCVHVCMAAQGDPLDCLLIGSPPPLLPEPVPEGVDEYFPPPPPPEESESEAGDSSRSNSILGGATHLGLNHLWRQPRNRASPSLSSVPEPPPSAGPVPIIDSDDDVLFSQVPLWGHRGHQRAHSQLSQRSAASSIGPPPMEAGMEEQPRQVGVCESCGAVTLPYRSLSFLVVPCRALP